MSEQKTATVELCLEELQAIGLTLALWKAEHEGVDFDQAAALVRAMSQTDPDVADSWVASAILKMSYAEEELSDSATAEELGDMTEARALLRAQLDQKFAQYEEEGRTLHD